MKLPLDPTQQQVKDYDDYVTFTQLKNKIKADAKKNLFSVELKFHYLKTHPNSKLPTTLSFDKHIEAYSTAIIETKELMKEKHEREMGKL